MTNALASKDKWESVWDGVKLPTIKKPVYDIDQKLKLHLPNATKNSLIEIGCAPGQWMAYFNKNFGYHVSGVEYAEVAAATTMMNMKIQGIDADVRVGDFFTYDFSEEQYDVVFSGGFIEHFRELGSVVERICGLSRRYVITIVPNLYGVNGAIAKYVVPKVYAEHNPIDVHLLEDLHSRCGLETMFCDYVGGVRFITPLRHYAFFKKHNYLRLALTGPVTVFNRLSLGLSKFLRRTPRLRLFSSSLMYIGIKKEIDFR